MKEKILLFAYIFFGILSISPVWHYIGVPNILVLTASLFLGFISFMLNREGIHIYFFLFFTGCIVLASLPAVYWGGDLRILLYPVTMLTSLFLILQGSINLIRRFISVASFILILVIIGAWIGTVVAFLGGSPLTILKNPDGRKAYFFYTTLSNFYFGITLRPSGIFDEPGALSFIICAIATMRHLLGMNKKTTWAMLFSGFITLSLAHFIYVLFHAFSEKWTIKKVIAGIIYLAVAFVILMQVRFLSYIPLRILARLTITAEGNFAGDNRSHILLNVIERLTDNTILWSIDPHFMNPAREPFTVYPQLGENPFSPLIYYGMFVAWPYYLVLFLMILFGMNKKTYFVLIGLFLLFLQRPYVLNMGYSLWAFLPLYTYFNLRYPGEEEIPSLFNRQEPGWNR